MNEQKHCCLLRSEISSGMCAKLRTVAASNNRDHARNISLRTLVVTFNRSHVNIGRATTSQSLLLLLARATYIMVLFFTPIPFVVNHTINATPPERLQHCQQIAYFCDCCRNMVQFLSGVERVKRYVNVRLHCIVSNLKKISKVSTLPPLENFYGRPCLRCMFSKLLSKSLSFDTSQ